MNRTPDRLPWSGCLVPAAVVEGSEQGLLGFLVHELYDDQVGEVADPAAEIALDVFGHVVGEHAPVTEQGVQISGGAPERVLDD